MPYAFLRLSSKLGFPSIDALFPRVVMARKSSSPSTTLVVVIGAANCFVSRRILEEMMAPSDQASVSAHFDRCQPLPRLTLASFRSIFVGNSCTSRAVSRKINPARIKMKWFSGKTRFSLQQFQHYYCLTGLTYT